MVHPSLMVCGGLALIWWLSPAAAGAAEETAVEELLQQARAAAAAGDLDEADRLVDGALEAGPKNVTAWGLRAALRDAQGRHEEAVAAYDQVLELSPELAAAYDQRGSAQFKQGRIAESITDFDKYIELNPAAEAGHWRRGISYYYAGEWDAGRRQFEGYQTVDDADVENAVWRFLCMAGESGLEVARGEILQVGEDRRVPMRQIYDLFAGTAQPEDVLAAAEAGQPAAEELHQQLFYAHLYLGLYYEAAGEAELARRHIEQAEEKKIGHYMWDVARVHAERLRGTDDRPADGTPGD